MKNHYMQYALKLAEKGRLTVSPNPMVGCIIVKNNKIIGQGYHKQCGLPHAEIYALEEAGTNATNAEVYLTLEPCAHFGKTPPCVDALIAAKVKAVYIACIDPNPKVSGRGIEALKKANIRVDVGLCKEHAEKLNEIFFYYVKTSKPFVIAKWAMSLDGKTSTHSLDVRNISGDESHIHAHQLRQCVDAILVGANTIRKDDPQLTVRLSNTQPIKHPLRVILTRSGNLPSTAQVFQKNLPGKTIIVSTEKINLSKYNNFHIQNIVVCKNRQNEVDLNALLIELGKMGMTSLLVEGGMQMHEKFFMADLVNQYQLYLAPVIIGQNHKKIRLSIIKKKQLGSDLCFIAENEVTV